MVKFTFASAALIITSLSAFVSASPATFGLYNITSFQTGYAILSDGTEHAGDDVATVQASRGTPNTTTVAIYQFGDGLINTFRVQGKAGLYVTVQQDSVGTHLTWGTEVFRWLFTSSDPDSDFGSYNNYTVNIPGKDLFWYDTNDQATFVSLQNEAAAPTQQLYFQIQTVEVQ